MRADLYASAEVGQAAAVVAEGPQVPRRASVPAPLSRCGGELGNVFSCRRPAVRKPSSARPRARPEGSVRSTLRSTSTNLAECTRQSRYRRPSRCGRSRDDSGSVPAVATALPRGAHRGARRVESAVTSKGPVEARFALGPGMSSGGLSAAVRRPPRRGGDLPGADVLDEVVGFAPVCSAKRLPTLSTGIDSPAPRRGRLDAALSISIGRGGHGDPDPERCCSSREPRRVFFDLGRTVRRRTRARWARRRVGADHPSPSMH